MKISFLENWQFNQKLGLPLSSIKIVRLKYYLYNPTRNKIKETSKVTIFQIFSKLGKNLEVLPRFIFKKPISLSFS